MSCSLSSIIQQLNTGATNIIFFTFCAISAFFNNFIVCQQPHEFVKNEKRFCFHFDICHSTDSLNSRLIGPDFNDHGSYASNPTNS